MKIKKKCVVILILVSIIGVNLLEFSVCKLLDERNLVDVGCNISNMIGK